MEHKNKPRGNPIIQHINAEVIAKGESPLLVNKLCDIAFEAEENMPSCAELSVGLRHLLDAITAFKRAFKEAYATILQGDISGEKKCCCVVSFHGERKNAHLIKITDIVGIETYCGIPPSAIELPLPLPPEYKLAWHNTDGFEVLEIIGAPAPTFIPCLGDGQLDNICAHLGRPVPAKANE